MPSTILNKVIIENYDGFKKEIISLGKKYGICFDEDVFNGTYIKCCETLQNREITEEGVKYYFWVAFLNNSRKKYRRSKYKPILSELNENIYNSDDDMVDEEKEYEEKCDVNDNTALFDEENYNVLNIIPENNDNNNNIKSQEKKYNDNFFKLFDMVKNAVINKFGLDNFKVWSLHFINHKSYEELKTMGMENINFHNLFRQINFYIKNTLPKDNKKFKKLLDETLIF